MSRDRSRVSAGLAVLLCVALACDSNRQPTIQVAVASNFATPFRAIAAQFAATTGTAVITTTGSTGKLHAQICNGAPFAAFLAADQRRPRLLEQEGYALTGSRFTYATGRLALIARNGPADFDELVASTSGAVAIAQPRLAPYGRAAQQVLVRLGLLERLGERLVRGSSVAQALQLVESGNAAWGLVALSQVAHRGGIQIVPAEWHDPIRQDAVAIDSSAHELLQFIATPATQHTIEQFGYGAAPPVPATAIAVDTAFDARPIWLTLRLALTTTALLMLLGTPLAWWLARTRSRLRHVAAAVVAMPLVLPPTVLGFYLLLLLSPESPIGGAWQWASGDQLVFSFSGLVVGSVIYSLPFVVQPLRDAFEAVGPRPLEAAATLGAAPWDRFRTIAVPLALPGFITAAVLAFAHTLGEFGVVLMIGGNIPGRTQVLSVAIYDHVEALDYGRAHTLSALLLGVSFATLLLVYTMHHRHRQRTLTP